ncbi:glycosyltransferase [Candidatus Woesearchaeota archaeon]|nr:glycosyltransferase [Candidatus Woesearchaeota archaeon]
MKSVLHIIDTFLPLTNSWIYYQIAFLKDFNGLVLTNRVENAENYPFDKDKIIQYPYFFIRNRLYYDSELKTKFMNTLKYTTDFSYRFLVNKKFRKLREENNIKLLHAHFGTNGMGFIKLKKALGVPLITSFYGYDLIQAPKREPGIYNKLFKEGDLFLVEGSNAKKVLINAGCDENKIIINHLGIDVNKFPFKERKSDKEIILLMVARFEEKKGIEYLIRAFAKIEKKYNNVKLRLIGDGQLRLKIEELIKSLNLRNIELVGLIPLNRLVEELLNAHIFVHPSVTAENGDIEGGAPIVLLNAQATGMPVVSTLHCDIPEEVIDKKSGFLVSERDVDALADRLSYLIENPKLWKQMGKYGRDHVEKEYDILKQIESLEKIYNKLL